MFEVLCKNNFSVPLYLNLPYCTHCPTKLSHKDQVTLAFTLPAFDPIVGEPKQRSISVQTFNLIRLLTGHQITGSFDLFGV
jgi:hypothetical protein